MTDHEVFCSCQACLAEGSWFRAHVEKCIRELWDDEPVTWDEDGDIAFRADTAAVWVTFRPAEPRLVVFAHAAYDVKETAAVLKELNQVSGRSTYAKVFVSGGVVIVESTLPAEAVNPRTLRLAIDSVAMVAQRIGVMVAAMFDGCTPFPAEQDLVEEDGS